MRERFASLTRGQMVGLVIVVVIVLGAAGLWYMRSLPQPVHIAAAGPPGGVGGVAAAAPAQMSPSPSPSPSLILDVAGWVRHPGVYEFGEDDRVIDAVDRAGGPRKGADLASLNLAAPLTDGQQILVPPPPSRAQRDTAAAGGDPADQAGLININSASATDLEGLSGIGEVLAAAIVDYREENGPFESIEQLEDVSGIGPATLEEIRADVTV